MMSGPGDIRLLWQLGRCRERLPPRGGGGGRGGSHGRAGLGKFGLALATLGSGRVLRLRKSFDI